MQQSKPQILEIIGISSVVFSLIFVAYEISQTNQIAIATMEYEVRNNYSSLNEEIITNTELAGLLTRLKDPAYQLEGTELTIAVHFSSRLMNIWTATDAAFENGMIESQTHTSLFLREIPRIIGRYPGLEPAWYDLLDTSIPLKDMRSNTVFQVRSALEQ